MTEPEHPRHVEPDTRAAATDGPPVKTEGDPLLAASQGATEGTDGTRHGVRESQDG